MNSLARRVLTGTLLVLGATALLLADEHATPGWVPFFCALAISLLCAFELRRMGRLAPLGVGPPLFLGILLSSAFVGYRLFETPEALDAAHPALTFATILLVVALASALAPVFVRPKKGELGNGALWGLGLALWTLPSLFALVPFGVCYGTRGLVVLVALSKVGDIFGYFVGRKIGERRPFPSLSPGKTVAGCVASLVAGSVAGAVLLPFTFPASATIPGSAWGGALLGAGLNLAAQAGDLAESWVKRRAAVGDSSTWVGAAGGVLDVVDSLFFTTPVAVFLWPLVV
jgi:phosphatidate cytidylyltransferase